MIPLWIFVVIFGLLLWPLLFWLNHRYNFEARFTHWLKHLFFLALLLGSSLAEAQAGKPTTGLSLATICQQLKAQALAEGYALKNPSCFYQTGYVVLTREVLVRGVLERRGLLMQWVGGGR